MRIAVSGAHGVGKTTLANRLAEEFRLPLIKEVAREAARVHGYRNADKIRTASQGQQTLYQLDVYFRQIKSEEDHLDGFVSNRSVFDSVAYTELYGLASVVKYLLPGAVQHSGAYDLIIYCPVPDGSIADDGFRLADRESQQEVGRILTGLLKKALCPVFWLPPKREIWFEVAREEIQKMEQIACYL